jgi:citrate lyase subunit beta/citryl-CoA lyase
MTAATWRSLLYMPANVPRFVVKASGAGADAVVLDLEDSVPADRKEEARDGLAEAIATLRAGATPGDILVRVNRPPSLAVRDIEAAARAGADGIQLAKTLGPDHVVLAAELMAEHGTRPMALVPMIETAAAVPKLEAIAAAHPSVTALLIGAEDLAAECGAAPDDELIAEVKRRMVLAATAAGVAPLGTLGTVADFRDATAVAALARRSRRAGLSGATCIHPSLVPVLNEAFAPSAEEVEEAKRMLEAAEPVLAAGRGAFTFEGKMVDEPVLIRAHRLLARAR